MAGARFPVPDYAFYHSVYGGELTEEGFAASCIGATRLVRRLVGGKCLKGACEKAAVKRAVCAAVDALAEYGDGVAGGFSIGNFRMNSDLGNARSGTDMATEAALLELDGMGLSFTGVR